MKKTLFLLSACLLVSVLLLFGCDLFGSQTVVTTGGGHIHGFVEDQNGDPMEGVTVTYSIPDVPADASAKGTETVVTDVAGFFQINDLIPGTYRLTFTKGNYTLDTTTVTVTNTGFYFSDDESGETVVGGKHTHQVMATLYLKNASATGRIYVEQGNSSVPAAGRTVVATFNDRFSASATTNASGVFTLSGLPRGPVAIYAKSFLSSANTYYADFWVTKGMDQNGDPILVTFELKDGSKDFGTMVWGPSPETTEPVVISSNLSANFDVENDITLTFDKPITHGGTFTLFRDFGEGFDELLLLEPTWSADSMTVTLDPAEVLLTETDYFVEYAVTSTDGYAGTDTLNFTTIKGIKFITSNVLELDGTPAQNFSVSSDITLTFSLPIARYNLADIVLSDNVGAAGNILAASITLSADSKTLTINPTLNLENNKSYSIGWTVYSALDSGTNADTGSRDFKTEKAELLTPANVTGLVLNDPNDTWNADWNTTTVPLIWNRVKDANGNYPDGYLIFATDTIKGVEEFLVGTVLDPGPTVYTTTRTGNASLENSIFDVWPGVGVQPFAFGNEISFTIHAYVTNGDETLLSAASPAAVAVTDTTNPTATEDVGSRVNYPAALPYTAATAESIYLVFDISEALSTTQPAATITGQTWADANKPNAVRSSFNSQTVTIRIDLDPEDVITAGDTFTFQFNDTSGNTGSHTYTFVDLGLVL